jgi:hypothetical protein
MLRGDISIGKFSMSNSSPWSSQSSFPVSSQSRSELGLTDPTEGGFRPGLPAVPEETCIFGGYIDDGEEGDDIEEDGCGAVDGGMRDDCEEEENGNGEDDCDGDGEGDDDGEYNSGFGCNIVVF